MKKMLPVSQKNSLILLVTFSLSFVLLSPTFTFAAASSYASTTTRKHKGELELDPPTSVSSSTTLTLNVPPQEQQPSDNVWESQVYQTSGPNVPSSGGRGSRLGAFINPNSFRSKGDDGIIDTRGTVRYNILPNGFIAPGIITTAADENAPFTQANAQEMHAENYASTSSEIP